MKSLSFALSFILCVTSAVMFASTFSSCSQTKREMIQCGGSDTLVNVAQAWAEEYANIEKEVVVTVDGGGSGNGISSLLDGTVDIANASRKMKASEIERAKKNGFEPMLHVVGYDALAVFVHKNNPIESMTLAQMAEIYGEGGKTTSWDAFNIEIPGANSKEIIRFSRQNNSGTYECFKSVVLGKGRDFKLGSRDLQGSKEVVDAVHKTPGAIGYSGLAYAIPEVRMVPIAKKDGDKPVVPSVATAIDQTYPIARPLLMYTRGKPEGRIKKYLDWILSDAGQEIIQRMGYAPIRKIGKTD